MDIDVSMSKDFEDYDLDADQVLLKFKRQLDVNFSELNLIVFDEQITKKPKSQSKNQFWGGYKITFKIVPSEIYREHKNNQNELRKHSIVTNQVGQERKFTVDISKYEFTRPSETAEIDDYTITVYSPIMIIYEKLRAICQQSNTYVSVMHTNRKARARDFYDIYTVVEQLKLKDQLKKALNIEILKAIFEIKKVPLSTLELIPQGTDKDFHASNFEAVRESSKNSQSVKDFDFYYQYVSDIVTDLLKLI